MSITIEKASWGANICERLVLGDGRAVFLHYRMDCYGEPVWKLETIMVDTSARIGSARQSFDLAPVTGGEPDVLPEWLVELIASVPISAPRLQAVSQ